MSENGTNGEEKAPEPRKPMTIVEARREAAESFAKDASAFFDPKEDGNIPTKDELTTKLADEFEKSLLMAENRGMNVAKGFFSNIIKDLRAKLSSGPANHIEQAVLAFHNWTGNCADFVTLAQWKELKEKGMIQELPVKQEPSRIIQPRQFLGMNKKN